MVAPPGHGKARSDSSPKGCILLRVSRVSFFRRQRKYACVQSVTVWFAEAECVGIMNTLAWGSASDLQTGCAGTASNSATGLPAGFHGVEGGMQGGGMPCLRRHICCDVTVAQNKQKHRVKISPK